MIAPFRNGGGFPRDREQGFHARGEVASENQHLVVESRVTVHRQRSRVEIALRERPDGLTHVQRAGGFANEFHLTTRPAPLVCAINLGALMSRGSGRVVRVIHKS